MKTFPDDFVWGTATSSYQIEGGHDKGGRGPSIWDAFCSIPGKVNKGDTGNISIDHFHNVKEDVALLKSLGFKAYRFSISWSRILPQGRGKVNEDGINFDNDLINTLMDHEITPWITLYHWDLPLALQLEMDGWMSRDIVEIFGEYARVCFEHFGDRVKNWITLNEPWVVSILGHGSGVFAPGRVSNTEPYLVAHHQILAHAEAVKIYRSDYSFQGGIIGITNNCDWREPLTDTEVDRGAAERALLFFLGWFADPIFLGDYPQVMKDRLGNRLPEFTSEEKNLINRSADFFGLNHYTTMYAAENYGKNKEGEVYGNGGISEDQDVDLSVDKTWELTEMNWAVAPWGCRKLLEWIRDRYHNPPIYITENGCAYDDKVINGRVEDSKRVDFYKGYLEACHEAILNGVDLRGFFAWSLFDNFEWASGYSKRFGITFIDYASLTRIPKASAYWLKDVASSNSIS